MKLNLSKHFAAEATRLFSLLSDLPTWQVDPLPRVLSYKPNEEVIFGFEDQSRANLRLKRHSSQVTRIELEHEAIDSASNLTGIENFWLRVFAELTSRLLAEPISICSAAGKINIFFAVGALQANGYHEVASVYQAVELREYVSVELATDWKVQVNGNLTENQLMAVPTGEDNLVVAAAKAVKQQAGLADALKLDIAINKQVPVAGGMGGGSADAAAAILATNELLCAGLSELQMHEAAATLGADIPFALRGGTAIGVGRGEQLSEIANVPRTNWVLITSSDGLSTPAVYRRLDEMREQRGEDVTNIPTPNVSRSLLKALQGGNAFELAEHLHNDLQEAAVSLRPSLKTTMDDGIEAGALAAMVSGSGPTIALLAATESGAEEIARSMTAKGYNAIATHGPAEGARVEN